MVKNKISLPIMCIFVGFVAYTYRDLFHIFFQQDEWLTLGNVLVNGIFGSLYSIPILNLFSGTGRILGTTLNNIFYLLFRFNSVPFAFFAIGVHCINTILWYKISHRITKHIWVSLASASFFGVSFVAHQAITWFASVFTTLPSATFLFLSIIFIMEYIDKKKRKFLIGSQICVITAYLFKETAVFLFFFLPLYYYWNTTHKQIFAMCKKFIGIILYGIFVIGVRMYSITGVGAISASFVTSSGNAWQNMMYHTFFYPILSIPQMFIPPQIMFKLASVFQSSYYGNIPGFTASRLGIETIVSDYVSLICAFLLGGILCIVGYKTKIIRPWLRFGLVFSLMSFLPYIILYKGSSYLDSRYFYIGVAGGGIIVSSLMYGLYSKIRGINNKISFVTVIILVFVFGIYMNNNSVFIGRELKQLSYVSEERKNILYTIKKIYPSLPQNPIVYVTGNHYGYYAIPELKIPLQQGFGYTLMVIYQDIGIIPNEFLSSSFLWEIKDQGYREINGKGFGYYFDFVELKKFIEKNPTKLDSLVSFYYDSNSLKLTNSTVETKNTLLQ